MKKTKAKSLHIQEQHHFYQVLTGIDSIELEAFSVAERRAIVKAAELIVEKQFVNKRTVQSPKDVKQFLKLAIALEPREIFYVIYLNNAHAVITHEPLFFGTIDSAAVYPRVVVERALALHATAMIIAHQHPSGDCEPSAADKRLTEQLKAALALVDVRLVDHVVIAGTTFRSFADTGLL